MSWLPVGGDAFHSGGEGVVSDMESVAAGEGGQLDTLNGLSGSRRRTGSQARM